MTHSITLFSLLAVLLSTTSLAVICAGVIVFVVANAFFMRWMLKQLRAEPDLDSDLVANSGISNAIGDTPIRTSVGVPRNRSLRPREPSTETVPAGSASSTQPLASIPVAASTEPLVAGPKPSTIEPPIPFSPGSSDLALPGLPVATPVPSLSLLAEASVAGVATGLIAQPNSPPVDGDKMGQPVVANTPLPSEPPTPIGTAAGVPAIQPGTLVPAVGEPEASPPQLTPILQTTPATPFPDDVKEPKSTKVPSRTFLHSEPSPIPSADLAPVEARVSLEPSGLILPPLTPTEMPAEAKKVDEAPAFEAPKLENVSTPIPTPEEPTKAAGRARVFLPSKRDTGTPVVVPEAYTSATVPETDKPEVGAETSVPANPSSLVEVASLVTPTDDSEPIESALQGAKVDEAPPKLEAASEVDSSPALISHPEGEKPGSMRSIIAEPATSSPESEVIAEAPEMLESTPVSGLESPEAPKPAVPAIAEEDTKYLLAISDEVEQATLPSSLETIPAALPPTSTPSSDAAVSVPAEPISAEGEAPAPVATEGPIIVPEGAAEEESALSAEEVLPVAGEASTSKEEEIVSPEETEQGTPIRADEHPLGVEPELLHDFPLPALEPFEHAIPLTSSEVEHPASAESEAKPGESQQPQLGESSLVESSQESSAPEGALQASSAPSSQTAAAPAEDALVQTSRSHMTTNESTSNATGRASAQLTLGFEVTSLQLTPFFKLGAVQLRPLSNVVSLHLLTTQQAENPLAAGISFQIETVDLDEHSHIRSILLKPLPQAQAAATPQPKLQVDNVQLGEGTEGAPIQVTSSQGTSTAVQLLATCTIAAMDFTPAFEIGSLRLEPNSNFVLLRSAPTSKPAALDLPPSFEVANVQLEGAAQISSVRLTPSTAK